MSKSNTTSTHMSTTEVAAKLKVSRVTVHGWCQRGLFPGAFIQETPRGPVWIIPKVALKSFKRPALGRRPTAKGSKATKARATKKK